MPTLSDGIELFSMVVAYAIPFGIAAALVQLCVNMFMRMAFGGKIEVKI